MKTRAELISARCSSEARNRALPTTRIPLAGKLWLFALLVPALASAQPKDIQVTRGPTSELYIKKRPPTPEAPVLSQELKDMLVVTEKKRDDKRIEAIGLGPRSEGGCS